MVKPAPEPFRAQLPPAVVLDPRQMEWNLRQWRELEGTLRRVQVRLDQLEAAVLGRLDALEAAVLTLRDHWDEAP